MAPRCATLSCLRDLNRGQATPGSRQKNVKRSRLALDPVSRDRDESSGARSGLDEDDCGRFWSRWDVAFTGSVSPVGPGQAHGLFRSRWTINSKRIHKIRQIAQLSSSRVLPRFRGRFRNRVSPGRWHRSSLPTAAPGARRHCREHRRGRRFVSRPIRYYRTDCITCLQSRSPSRDCFCPKQPQEAHAGHLGCSGPGGKRVLDHLLLGHAASTGRR
jgi:hypothetical protein